MRDNSDSKVSSPLLALMADYFKVLSEVSRLSIIQLLKEGGAMNVTEIAQETGLGQANLSKHLKVLTQAGILSRQPSGVSVYYEIADPVIFDLCDLVCSRLKSRLEQQSKHLNRFSLK